VQWFRLQLQTGAAADARAYLDRRGLKPEALERWEIGFAPDAWQGLWDALKAKGVADELILNAGLAKPSSKGGKPYDTFRGRSMFPIRDARVRAIAFGGRAMDPNDNAKYLNSPETELFDKGRSLYNVREARAAVGQGHDLIVAEGYMDVIALAQDNFKGAVAPLGTAITENQLQMLWRIGPEPIIMLDGDTAGQRAAMRLIDLALPLLSESNSLFFINMPDGLDPDDYLKKYGEAALRNFLDEQKMPLVRLLWNREYNSAPTDTPEQKAGFDKRIRSLLASIQDKDIQRYYAETLKQWRWEAFRPTNHAPEYRRKPTAGKGRPLVSTLNSRLAQGGGSDNLLEVRMDDMLVVHERTVAAIAAANPKVAIAFQDGLELFEVGDASVRSILRAICSWSEAPEKELCRELLEKSVGTKTSIEVLEDRFAILHPAVRRNVDAEIILHELAGTIAKVTAYRAAEMENSDAKEDIYSVATEAITWRISQSNMALEQANRGEAEDRTEYKRSGSGAQVNVSEQNAFDEMLGNIRRSMASDETKHI